MKISVVMSTYNDAATLPASIDSVLNQDFRDVEFIIVNDGSPDPRTAEILADYGCRDSRIRVITKANEGLTKALIDGCAAAQGEYIARIDVGDVMTPDRLARQSEILDQHPEVAFVSCWTEYCGPEWEYLRTERGASSGVEGSIWIGNVLPEEPGQNLKAGPTSHPSVMMRSDAYRKAGGYRWQFYYGQDWDLWYRLAAIGMFGMVARAMYRVRFFPEGISARHRERQRACGNCSRDACRCRLLGTDESECLAEAARIRPGIPRGSESRPSRAEGWHFLGAQLLRNGDPRCRAYFREAIRRDPFRSNSWFRLAQSFLTTLGAVRQEAAPHVQR